jgi:hypothetical protein
MQDKRVPEFHDVVAQIVVPIAAEGVRLVVAKLKPSRVTVPPALEPMLRVVYVTAGASNEKTVIEVPTSAEIVSARLCDCVEPAGVGTQVAEVSVAQTVDPHTVAPIEIVGEEFSAPKLKPRMVTVAPCDVGEFGASTTEIAGVSYVNMLSKVPVTEAIEATTWVFTPCPDILTQTSAVDVLQLVVLHAVEPSLTD